MLSAPALLGWIERSADKRKNRNTLLTMTLKPSLLFNRADMIIAIEPKNIALLMSA